MLTIPYDAVAQNFYPFYVLPKYKIGLINTPTSDRRFPNVFWGTFIPYLKKDIPVVVMSASSQDSPYKTFSNEVCEQMYEHIKRYAYCSVRDTWTQDMFKHISNGTIVPDLATEYSIRSDGKTWTVNLRNDVKFSDNSSFNAKDTIEDTIADYNKDVDETKQIKYTDYIGIMMSSVSSIIDAITYILIAFVSISLIVSSIMIGVITLISVQERTKEIGILRALGASKRNVSSLFNAETVIVGFSSGLLGVVITYLLCIPINLLLHAITGIQNLNAILPFEAAIILVIISVCLTLISGIIP